MSGHPKILAGAREAQQNKDQLSSFSRSLELSIFNLKPRGRRFVNPRIKIFFQIQMRQCPDILKRSPEREKLNKINISSLASVEV